MGAVFDGAAFLTGATVEPAGCLIDASPGAACTISLVWRAEREMTISYRVFVHLIDDTGNILAQSDAEPARWTRPTTGWAPGEYVVDTHAVILPPELSTGSLRLRVGLYDPATGTRLATPSGVDHVLLE